MREGYLTAPNSLRCVSRVAPQVGHASIKDRAGILHIQRIEKRRAATARLIVRPEPSVHGCPTEQAAGKKTRLDALRIEPAHCAGSGTSGLNSKGLAAPVRVSSPFPLR